MSPGSHGSGSPVEDESKIAIAKISTATTHLNSNNNAGALSSQTNIVKLADREKRQIVYKHLKKSPSPPGLNNIDKKELPKKFFRLGSSKNGVIRLSPSPPPS